MDGGELIVFPMCAGVTRLASYHTFRIHPEVTQAAARGGVKALSQASAPPKLVPCA